MHDHSVQINNLRQIWLGNLHPETTPEDICNVIRGGMIINVKLMLDKHCAFVTFVEAIHASNFLQYATFQAVIIRNRRIKVGWGKAVYLSEKILEFLKKGATRNIYLGGIDNNNITLEKLNEDFLKFGKIEQIHIIKEKNTAFVNFTCLLNAVNAYDNIAQIKDYSTYSIRFGKDRCSYPLRAIVNPFIRNVIGNPMTQYQDQVQIPIQSPFPNASAV